MATEKLNIGPVPYEESCASLGFTPDFEDVARAECRAYRAALIAYYGVPPEGARLRVVGNPHDFGTYYELYVFYDTEISATVDYAFTVEQGLSLWEQAGFSAPYSYGERGSIVERHFENTDHLIAKAIATLRAGEEIMPPALTHLTTCYPEAAALADTLTGTVDQVD
ncbi:hypothetical protein DFR49_0749 [Hephaestia caeni]|uniref:Uncharacterized protein n=1 Tax=Hephaestia caeni TaxID=645617 RepID=A0A397P9E7_9SPHN|nr:hypothetical protein [Hephaestia caeni]RIA46216.1 hypothetical protein DFR49_0749 [Hephaestia caeni]